MLTSPQRDNLSPMRKTKSISLWDFAQERMRAIRGVAMLSKATTGGPSKDAAQQHGTAACSRRKAPVTGAPEAAAELEQG